MPPATLEEALEQVLLRAFGRTPGPRERELWLTKIKDRMPAEKFLLQLVRTRGFLANQQVKTKFPAGHFFSPVVDPAQVRDHVARARLLTPADILGIDFDMKRMAEFWRRHGDLIAATRRRIAAISCVTILTRTAMRSRYVP
jgi:hypothetical protein